MVVALAAQISETPQGGPILLDSRLVSYPEVGKELAFGEPESCFEGSAAGNSSLPDPACVQV